MALNCYGIDKREVDLEIMNLPLEGAATMKVELPIQKRLKKVIHELCQISTIDRTLAQTQKKKTKQASDSLGKYVDLGLNLCE